jgi:hypothetical protein
MSGILLQNGFQHFQRLGAVEVGALLRDHFQAGIIIHDAVKSFRAVPGVVVADQAQQFDIFAVSPTSSTKYSPSFTQPE